MVRDINRGIDICSKLCFADLLTSIANPRPRIKRKYFELISSIRKC